MKKDIYPDVRIEIISEGLTKKILESSGSPAPSVYGEEQPEGKNLPNVGIKGKNKELQSLLETSNKKPNYTGLVKEAILELRKAPQGGQYGDFQPGGTTKRKEAAPVPTRENVYEEFDRMGGDTTSSRRPESTPSVAPSDRADVKEAIASADAPVTSRENVYDEAKKTGITPYGPYETFGGGTAAPTGEEAPFGSGSPYSRTAEGLGSGTTESIDYRPQDKKTTAKETSATDISDLAARTGTGTTKAPEGFDAAAVSALAAREAAAPTGGAGKKEEDKSGTPTPSLVGGPDVDEDVLEGRSSGTLPPDESTEKPEGDKGTEGTGDVDATASEIATDVTGTEPEESSTPEIDPKITSELDRGVYANPELTRPKNERGNLLPQFGSSGYFDAIVSIGEGGKNVEANYGVKTLTDFLELYPQNPQFDQTKFETNFKIEPVVQNADIEKANPFKASLKKQAPPMAMTMNRPPNMGVGQQQPVVTGAGTMKNTEKAVAANKPAAAPAKTKARRRKPKTIEMMVKSITDAVMKQQESDVDTFSSSKQNYGDLSKPRTRMSDTGPDEYGDTNQFIPTPTKQFQPSKKTLSARPEVYRGE